MWGEGCHFEPFGLPGSKLEGTKAALVDLLVREMEREVQKPEEQLAVCRFCTHEARPAFNLKVTQETPRSHSHCCSRTTRCVWLVLDVPASPSEFTWRTFSNPAPRTTLPLAAFVALQPPQVMGSFDDFVMTPHSSFSELGATLSHTWLPDPQAALRALPNRPIVPIFPKMNAFERQKVLSLLDRRAAEIVPVAAGGAAGGGAGGGDAVCMRVHAAGMSVVVARGRELLSMFEAIEGAPCMKGKGATLADL